MTTCTLTPPLQSIGSSGRRLLQTSTTAAPEPPPPPPATVSVNEQQALTTILASVNQLATGQAELATNIATLGTEIDAANEEAAVSALLCSILLRLVTETDARVLVSSDKGQACLSNLSSANQLDTMSMWPCCCQCAEAAQLLPQLGSVRRHGLHIHLYAAASALSSALCCLLQSAWPSDVAALGLHAAVYARAQSKPAEITQCWMPSI